MRFAGFPPEGIEFYERLEVENTKDFWQAHKRRLGVGDPRPDGRADGGAA